jgi:hypothetical protein
VGDFEILIFPLLLRLPTPAIWNLACRDINYPLSKLARVCRALWMLPSGHVAGLGGTALVIPSGDGLGFHLSVCGLFLRFAGHSRNMALGRRSRYGSKNVNPG